jgi:hypothetical protein
MTEQQQEIQPMEAEEDEVQAEEISFEQRFRALETEFLPEGVTFIPSSCVCALEHLHRMKEKDNVIDLLTAQNRRLKDQVATIRVAARNMDMEHHPSKAARRG